MSQIVGYRSRVLLAPFEREGAKAQVKGGFATVQHKNVLAGLVVVYGNGDDIHEGDIVYVNADGAKSWGSQSVEVDGKTVVICPPEYIFAVKRFPPPPPPRPEPTRTAPQS